MEGSNSRNQGFIHSGVAHEPRPRPKNMITILRCVKFHEKKPSSTVMNVSFLLRRGLPRLGIQFCRLESFRLEVVKPANQTIIPINTKLQGASFPRETKCISTAFSTTNPLVGKGEGVEPIVVAFLKDFG